MRHRRNTRSTVTAVVVACLLIAAVPGPAWSGEDREDAAQAAAETWLKLVDEGKYQESWERAAELFRGAVTAEQWKQAVGGVRGPLGEVVSRKIKSRQYMEQLPGAPDGKYVVLQFETVFEKKSSATETVTPMVDSDGVWRVSGYFVK